MERYVPDAWLGGSIDDASDLSPYCKAILQGHVQNGTKFVGSVESQALTHVGTSVLDCCQQCGAAADCSYFTFSTNRGTCQMHSRVAGLTRVAGAVSGALDGAPAPPPPLTPPHPSPPRPMPPGPPSPAFGCMVQKRAQYGGNLLGYIPARSAKTCCTECGKATACTAFTFNPKLLRCSCLSNVTHVVDDAESFSGNISSTTAV
eukprot:COSAG02_NODE_24990_length_671_cov_2.854895_1_plen_204_part_00